jgi:hypothetical protein
MVSSAKEARFLLKKTSARLAEKWEKPYSTLKLADVLMPV